MDVVCDTAMQYLSFLDTIHDLRERNALRDDQFHAWKEWTEARIDGLMFDHPATSWRRLGSG